ncbi:MAG: (2Fe-2S) ferredoxin domain-containing protein [Chitinophagaceae bacterium]|nr:MAG: (2Fe-2S) ferredoxin domain-containing protein [Chitinophagaceae bacterium]
MKSNTPYNHQIFVCTNERKQGGRTCCGERNGLLLVGAFKKLLKDKKLNSEVRAQRAGCFDFCEYGPIVVIYPEGIVYGKVEAGDVEEIVNQHIVKGNVVKKLLVDFSIPAEIWQKSP